MPPGPAPARIGLPGPRPTCDPNPQDDNHERRRVHAPQVQDVRRSANDDSGQRDSKTESEHRARPVAILAGIKRSRRVQSGTSLLLSSGHAENRQPLLIGLLLFVPSSPPAPPGRRPPAFDVRGFGAKGDGTSVDSGAINKAIDAAAAAGGGIVDLPAGRYLELLDPPEESRHAEVQSGRRAGRGRPGVGPRPIRSARANAADRYQDFGHSHWRNSLISAIDVENVAIVGPGLIDGRGLTRGGRARPGRGGGRAIGR